MTDAKAAAKVELKVERPPQSWGLAPDAVLQKLQARPVLVRLHDGTSIVGVLVGYSQFQLVVRCPDNIRLVSKGFAATVELSRGQSGSPA